MVSKRSIQKWASSISVLAICCALGLFFGLNSWNKNLYVSWTPKSQRGLAEEGSQNLLNLSSENLTQTASSILFSNQKIFQDKGFLSFYLGNILIPDKETKQHRFICEVFPLVEFSFSALGMSISGEKGQMIVQSPCNMEDVDWIGPFWLAQDEIIANSEKQSFHLEDKETFIRFYNASIELTPSWLLSRVRFFNNNDSEELLIQLNPNQTPYFELELLK